VKARIGKGEHDIRETMTMERFDRSRENLIRLLPRRPCKSTTTPHPADAETGEVELALVLEMEGRRMVECVPDEDVPEWTGRIMDTAHRLQGRGAMTR
jgi:hypothetical protein